MARPRRHVVLGVLLLVACGRTAPFAPLELEAAPTKSPDLRLSANWCEACLLDEGGALTCWQVPCFSKFPTEGQPVVAKARALGTGWLAVSSGIELTCGVRAPGQLFCWGRNRSGVLGPPSAEQHEPVRLGDGYTDYVDVAAGSGYVCAIRTEGSLHCFGGRDWGENGELPRGPSLAAPRLIPGRYSAVSAHWYRTGALTTEGELFVAENDDAFMREPDAGYSTRLSVGVLAVALVSPTGLSTVRNEWPDARSRLTDEAPLDFDAAYERCWVNKQHQLWCTSSDGRGAPEQLDGSWLRVAVGADFVCGVTTDAQVRCRSRADRQHPRWFELSRD